jgi:hypothetical protein
VAVAVLSLTQSIEKCVFFFFRNLRKKKQYSDVVDIWGHGGMGSGSGWVAVVPLDRGDQCGSNGTR